MAAEPGAEIARLAQDLALSGEDARVDLARIEASWRAPEPFAAALWAAAEQATGPLASRPGASVALYVDAVLRHRDRRTPALLSYAQERGWTALGYAELEQRAASLAIAWRAAGVKPAAVVAVLLEPGPAFATACLAAWRLGAAVSVLSPRGALTLSHALDALAPQHLVFDPRDPPPLPATWRLRPLPTDAPARQSPLPPASYAPAAPMAKVLSPLRSAPDPVELSAQQAFVSALRDAALAFRLAPGRRLAAPLVDAPQHYPALLLACLASGATLVCVPDDVLRRTPQVLDEQPLDTVLLCDAARAALEGATLRNAERWSLLLRSVEEPLDWERSNAFVKRQRAGRVATGNVLFDSAAGGALLLSAHRPGSSSARVLPVPGQAWSLKALGGAGREAASGAGVFCPVVDKKPLAPAVHLLASLGHEYLFGGTVELRRAGRVYPRAEVLEVAGQPAWCEGAGLVEQPVNSGHARFVLCLFTGVAAVPADALSRLRTRLAAAVGELALPDSIELFPGYPHPPREKSPHKVDSAWLSSQYQTGLLHEKARDDRYAPLRALTAALRAP